MTDTVNQLISYGLHSSSSNWTTTPTMINVRLADNNHLWPKPEYNKITRSGVIPDTNDPVAGLRGPKNMLLGDVSMECDGLSSSGAGDGVAASSLSTTLESAYEALFGVAHDSSTGELTDATEAGTGTSLIMASSSVNAATDWVLAQNLSEGYYLARQIESVSTDTLTVCRGPTTIDGNADGWNESQTAYGALDWYTSNTTPNHKHMGWKVEHVGGYEGQFNGCFPMSAGWSLAVGDVLKFNMGGMTATTWTKQAAQGGSYSAPTSGNKIVCTPIYFYIGSALYMAHDISIDLGLQVAPRPANQTEANMYGHVVVRMAPTISATITYGDISTPQEATNSLVDTWQAATAANSSYTADVLIQAGNRPGGTAAWRAEALDFTDVQHVDVNGMEGVRITGTCTEASGAQGVLAHAIF